MSLIRNRFSFISGGSGGGGGSASLPFSDVDILLADDSDPTKQAKFELSSISSGNTRTLTIPNKNGIIATTSDIPDVSGYLTKTQFEDLTLNGMLKDGTTTSISFDGTNTFTLTDNGAGWAYYLNGVKYSFTGNRTVVLAGTPVATGMYYFYFDDGTGVLKSSTSFTFGSVVLVATVCFNNSLTPKYWLADERHAVVMDKDTQYFIHHIFGGKLLSVPTLSGYTLDSDVDTAKTFAISEGKLIDQDIQHTLTALSDPNGTGSDYVVCYRTGVGTWVWKKSTMPFAYNVGNTNNTIQYDNGGTMTDCTTGTGSNRRWVCSYLLGTNITGDARFHIVMGRNQYTTLLGAQTEDPTGFSWTGLPIAEQVIIYKLIWDTTTSTSTGLCRLTQVTLVNQSAATPTTTSIQHNALLGLQGGTTSEYYHLTNAQVTKLDAISGSNTGDQNLFSTIAVSGQSNVVADSTTDTLTLAAGTGITLTTDASTDTVTIASTGGSSGDIVGVVKNGKVYTFYDEFANSVLITSAQTTYAVNQHFRTVNGTGAVVAYSINDKATYPSISTDSYTYARFETGTTNTGYANVCNTIANLYNLTDVSSKFASMVYEVKFRLEDLGNVTEDYSVNMGWARTSGVAGFAATDQPAGINVSYNYARNSGSLVLNIENSSATNVNLTHTALAADTWYTLKIEYNLGVNVKVYLDGTLLHTETTLTNVPTGATNYLNPSFGVLKVAGTTNRVVYADYVKIINTLV